MHSRTVRICTRVGGVAALAFVVGTLAAGLFAPVPAAAQGEPTCQDRCQRAAQEALRRCEAAGGENCAERARQALQDCLSHCTAGGGPRPTPGTGSGAPCGERCRARALEVLHRCEAAGGENCAQRAREAYSQCLLRCQAGGGGGGTPPSCTNRCRAMANEVLHRCEAAGGENCAERARQAYQDCAAKCPTGGGGAPEFVPDLSQD